MQRTIPGGWRDVASICDRALAEAPDAVALVGRTQRYSYLQLEAAVNMAAAALQTLGVGPGDRVAATLANHPDAVLAFLATQRLGAVWLGVNRALAGPEKIYQLQDSEARVYLADRGAAEQVAGARADLPALAQIIDIDPAEPWNAWRALVERHAGAARPAVSIDPDAPAAIAYTSGTTGRPKGAVHSQHNMAVVAAAGLAGVRGGHWRQRLRVGVYLPLTILNLLILDAVTAFAAGGSCVCIDRSDAGGVADWIAREGIEAIHSAPATIFDLVSRPEISVDQLATLKFVSCGGAVVPEELKTGFAAKFAKPMYPAYGMTEAPTSVAGHIPERECAPGSCGFPYDHLRLAVLDAAGRELPAGDAGELCIRETSQGAWAGVYTPMLGYWRRPRETEAALQDGWLHSGDIAIMDADGNVFLQDRLKDMIIRGGSNIYPAEVERVLKLDARVRDAAVVGRSDPRLGEVVAAFIEPVPDANCLDTLQADLAERCRCELAKYKVPEVWIFLSAMPRNSMNKILKDKLRERLEPAVDIAWQRS
jgi:acyl-CoA synthetase (AMP-forming)/AMP-acid ligase II